MNFIFDSATTAWQFFCPSAKKSVDFHSESRYTDDVVYEMKGLIMAYEYTLEDIYKILQQAEDKVAQLREFRDLKLPSDITWDRLIELYS